MPKYFANSQDMLNQIKKNVRTAVARIADDTAEKLIENTEKYWYNAYSPTIYERMGEDGGVLGAVDRDSISQIGKSHWESDIGFDISQIKMDIQQYESSRGIRKYGRHQKVDGTDMREEVIHRMENTGVKGHTTPAHMIERTANWLESQISKAENVERVLNSSFSSGMHIELKKTKNRK